MGMLVLADMLPTLLELSMLPSVRLSPKPMLKLFTIPMEDMVLDTVSILLDMVMDMVIMLDSDTLLLAMVIMVMVLDILGTMESVRLMLSMEPTVMVMDLDTVHTPLDIADTLVMDRIWTWTWIWIWAWIWILWLNNQESKQQNLGRATDSFIFSDKECTRSKNNRKI